MEADRPGISRRDLKNGFSGIVGVSGVMFNISKQNDAKVVFLFCVGESTITNHKSKGRRFQEYTRTVFILQRV